jgi:hypothetical protein
MTLAVGLAVLAALLFGTGTALQAHAAAGHRPGRDTGSGPVLHLRSLGTVVAQPMWLAGTVLDWLGALTHLAALHYGPLTLVQPLSLTALVFAVPAEAVLARRRPSSRQMVAATQTALGLVLVAFCLGRRLPISHAGAATSTTGVVVAGLGIVVLVLCTTRSRSSRHQALLLGSAAGSAYGLSDALARAVQVPAITQVSLMVELLAGGIALTAGAVGLGLTQAALQRSRLSASMPAQDLLALLVSIALGATLLGEVPHLTNTLLLGTLIALLLTGHGILQLSRTSQTSSAQRLDDKTRDPDHAPVASESQSGVLPGLHPDGASIH